MKTLDKLKKLFKEPIETDINEKWLMVGFFTGVFILFSVLIPIMMWNNILMDYGLVPMRDFSYLNINSWIQFSIIIIPTLTYLLCWWILKDKLVTFAVNISMLMYKNYEMDKAKKNGMGMLKNVE